MDKFDATEVRAAEYSGSPGADHDAEDMRRLGKTQQLHRSMNTVHLIGLTCAIMCTWMGVLSTGTFSLINGGRAGTIWLFLGTWMFTFTVVASLAEMASMSPTAGGQYHWVSEFAPPSMQKFVSYVSGWLAALGWQAFIAASAYQAGSLILIMASTRFPEYQPAVWHVTLMTMAIGMVAVLFNVFGAKHIPLFESLVLGMYVIGFFAITTPLWALAPKASASAVFTEFSNFGGWPSIGAACVVGQMAGAAAFIGVDSAVHMAEEVKNASVVVPRAMMITTLINGGLGFAMIITYCFCIQNLEEQIIMSEAPYPFVEVFQTATGSVAAGVGMTMPIFIMTFMMCINCVAAASRQAWSFARDDGLAFPRWFTKLNTINSTPLPINAMLASLVILIVVALLNFGGAEVFNSIIGLMTGAVGLTYAISIACVLWRRLFGQPLPAARWSLGRWGVPINAIALVYELFSTVISFFPLVAKVDAKSMNWGIAMFAGVSIICIVNYLVHARKVYRGPVVHVDKNV